MMYTSWEVEVVGLATKQCQRRSNCEFPTQSDWTEQAESSGELPPGSSATRPTAFPPHTPQQNASLTSKSSREEGGRMSTTLMTFSWLKCRKSRISRTIRLASTRSSNAPGIFFIATCPLRPAPQSVVTGVMQVQKPRREVHNMFIYKKLNVLLCCTYRTHADASEIDR